MRAELPHGHLFRKLRNYHQIWPFVYGQDEWWMSPSDSRPPEVDVLVPAMQTIGAHAARRYFGEHLHGARVLGLQVDLDEIRLTLDDPDVNRLSAAVDNRMGIRQPAPFPVTLQFSFLNAWCAYGVNPQGRLGRVRHSLSGNLAKVQTYHCDQILRWDFRRFVGFFNFLVKPSGMTILSQDAAGWSHVLHSHSLVLAIDAEDINVVEGQRNGWRAKYGDSLLPIFDEFWFRREEYVSSGPGRLRSLVEERMPRLY